MSFASGNGGGGSQAPGRTLAASLANLVFPPVCPACRAVAVPARQTVCPACTALLQPLPKPRCPGCGGVIDGVLARCGDCLRGAGHPWEHAVSAFPFSGLPRDLVHRFKYQGDTAQAPFFGAHMLESWRRHGGDRPVDAVVPVPLHWWRSLCRGYNQAALLAEPLAAGLGVPVQNLLRRRRHTGRQASLDRRRRQENMRHGFAVRPGAKVRDRCILLVDDVITTGATLAAAAEALLQDGAGRVYVITLARG